MEYKIKEITPESMVCGVGPCPGIYDHKEKGKYLIIGNIADAKNYKIDGISLERKVGPNEVLIEIDKKLIDEKAH